MPKYSSRRKHLPSNAPLLDDYFLLQAYAYTRLQYRGYDPDIERVPFQEREDKVRFNTEKGYV